MINLIPTYVVTTGVMRTIRACPLARALNYLNYVFSVVQWISAREDLLQNVCVCVTMHALCSDYSTHTRFLSTVSHILFIVIVLFLSNNI
jgi:hypothetical protein